VEIWAGGTNGIAGGRMAARRVLSSAGSAHTSPALPAWAEVGCLWKPACCVKGGRTHLEGAVTGLVITVTVLFTKA